MVAKKITSLQHPIVKKVFSIRQSKQCREQAGLVLICGVKQVAEMSKLAVLFVKEGFESKYEADETYVVTEEILKKITGLAAPEPVAALVCLPKKSDLKECRRILALDSLKDPGNVGTLIRTALALGWDGIFMMQDTVDPFNDKALRAAKGATFLLPLRQGSSEEFIAFAKERNAPVYVADAQGEEIQKKHRADHLILVLGSESHGVEPAIRSTFPRIAIPITGTESLNVAIAGAILMYELR